jgi:elongation factor Ts
MAEITAALVKQLREETQLPMMDCKKALAEAGGDIEVAKQTLREKGKVLMASRSDRSTEEGRVAICTGPQGGAMIELQVESAPVAGSDEVVQLAADLAKQLATGPGAKTADELWAQPSPSQAGKTLQDVKDELENKIREVFRLSRMLRVAGSCGGYVHHDGRTGVLLEFEGNNDTLAREISMHVAAMKPQAVNKDALDPSVVAKEKEIQIERARQEGKPENIIEKMIEGRMRNFFSEVVLEEQPFIKDDKQSVGQIATAGGLKLKGFTMWKVGEGAA